MVKKGIVALLIMIVAIFAHAVSAIANDTVYDYFKIVKLVIGQTQAEVNYQPAKMDQAAYIKQGRTLVPLRFIGESLGAQVTWNNTAKKAVLKLAGSTVTVTMGSKVAYVDGRLNVLDVPAEIKGGRTFVPLRFISESFGGWVDYDAETKTIVVRYDNESNWKSYEGPGSSFQFKYPADWVATTSADGQVDAFQSPHGSTMMVYWSDSSPTALAKEIEDDRKTKGWTLDAEVPTGSDDLADGFRLEFTIYDKQLNGTVREIFIVDPMDGGSFVIDQIFDDNYTDIDHIVMLDIANS